MKALLLYFLQVVVASGLLYAYYHFFLRNKKFHQYNRYFLLAASLLSILIPFLNIPVYFTHDQAKANLVLYTLSNISTPVYDADSIIITSASQNWFTWQNILYTAYILVATLVLSRIILSLRKIRLIIKRNPVEKIERIRFVNTEEPGTPFSFFRWLFWNKKIELQSEKGEQIFRHELFHIEQKHSLDIIFLELLSLVFWVNPFFYLMKREMKAIHEFLADQFAVKENDQWEYAELLLMQALNTQTHLTNPFFHNQIKRRIAMLTTSTKPGHQYLRKVLVLPVAAIVLALFAFKYEEKKEMSATPENNQLSDNRIDTLPQVNGVNAQFSVAGNYYEFQADSFYVNHPEQLKSQADLKDALIIFNNKKINFDSFQNKTIIARLMKIYPKNDESAINFYGDIAKNGVIVFEDARVENIKSDTLNPDNKIFEKVDVEASFPGGLPAWKQYLVRNLSGFNPAINGAPNGTYTVFIQFVVDKEGKISDVRSLTHYGYGMEEAAIRIIKKGPVWSPALLNGKKVKAYRKQPVTFVVTDGKTTSGNTTIKDIILNDKSKSTSGNLTKGLVVVNGEIIENSVLQNIPSENISSINVLKGASAIAKYGDKGRNGVIEVITKYNKDTKTKEIALIDRTDENNKIFEKTETVPSFPGGTTAWRKYLERTLSNYNPADQGAKTGAYTVMAQFIVDKEGNVSDIKTLTHFGYGMEDTVISMIKNGPKWIPAMQNGHVVKAYMKQPVTFVVQDENAEDPKTTKNDKSSSEANQSKSLHEVTVTGYNKGGIINKENSKAAAETNNLNEVVVSGYKKASPSKENSKLFKEDLDRLQAIYPNPSDNSVTIPLQSKINSKGNIMIYDETGNLKITAPINFIKGGNNYNQNISTLAKGVYFITITNSNKARLATYKMIKQ